MKRLLLVGGGHAQLAVLQALARQRPRAVEAVLLTPSPWQWYSGMLPGWMQNLSAVVLLAVLGAGIYRKTFLKAN